LEGFTYGSFIATASMSGRVVNGPQLQAAYNAAKAGVTHLCV
jgi:sorbose reductase